MGRGLSRFTITALTLGFAFLYLPIVLLVIYSFNASKLVTVWGGFSLEWYRVMLNNTALLDSSGDGRVDLADAVHVLRYVFLDGAPPVLGTRCVPLPGCPDSCGR